MKRHVGRSYVSRQSSFAFLTALACVLFLIVALHGPASAQDATERIHSFSSHITVNPDGTMLVTETIRVTATGDQIKRGIYRDFPTRYKDRLGNNYVVGFDVREVLRDGSPEGYHTEGLSNGVRVYIGKKDYFLPQGEYAYTLTYSTDRQLGFFKDHDELYWNVTGNGWVFPIDNAAATVVLPKGIPRDKITVDGYTGPMGSTGKDFMGTVKEDGSVSFASTRGLGSYEGLTIVVGWPKGFVEEPPLQKKVSYFLRDNITPLAGAAGLAVLLLYYISVWFSVGRDPEKGTIVPLYEPPDNLSPAALRFVTEMGYDDKAFAATVVNMAVKGFLGITEKDGQYTLHKNPKTKATLSRDEEGVASKLFGSGETIVLEQKNHTYLSGARDSLKTALAGTYEKNYFVKNRRQFIVGLLISVVALALAFLSARHAGDTLFLGLWLSVWSIGVAVLFVTIVKLWKLVFTGWGGAAKKGALGGAIFMTLFSIPFFGGELAGLYGLALASPVIVVFVGGAVFVNILFYHLLKAPTMLGRKLLDRIEGFKTFLSATEEDRLGRLYPVERTPELFEKYLPYALALDVEQPWTDQFSDILAGAAVPEGGNYHPRWYSGSTWDSGSLGSFAGSIGGSLAGAISSSSTAPGSRSGGGGGGGSSGGGGGGGGGGGW